MLGVTKDVDEISALMVFGDAGSEWSSLCAEPFHDSPNGMDKPMKMRESEKDRP